MKLTAQERFQKLPKWARERIENLERQLSERVHEVHELRANDPTRVAFNTFSGLGKNRVDESSYIPEDETIVFRLGKDPLDTLDANIRIRMVNENFQGGLSLDIHGTDEIEILPAATNHVCLKSRSRRG